MFNKAILIKIRTQILEGIFTLLKMRTQILPYKVLRVLTLLMVFLVLHYLLEM